MQTAAAPFDSMLQTVDTGPLARAPHLVLSRSYDISPWFGGETVCFETTSVHASVFMFARPYRAVQTTPRTRVAVVVRTSCDIARPRATARWRCRLSLCSFIAVRCYCDHCLHIAHRGAGWSDTSAGSVFTLKNREPPVVLCMCLTVDSTERHRNVAKRIGDEHATGTATIGHN